MSREARKGVVRILSNYTRLALTLVLGLLIVPLTIRWLGDDAFGIISLLGANIGLAAIFRQIIQQSLTRELGAAYHQGDESFRAQYPAVCLISLLCAGLTVVAFGIVVSLLPYLQIPDELMTASVWFVVGQGLNTTAMTLLAPMLNMYLVTERFVGYNIWYIGVRATNIISVLILGYAIGISDPATGLLLHGILWSGLGILGFGIAAMYIYSKDHRLAIRIGGARREVIRDVMQTFSWNSGVQAAMNIHEQIPPLLMNIFFGPLANAAWGIGFRFVAYIRMLTTGVQFGSDAVSARLASNVDSEQSRRQLQRLINIQTKLTTMIALPAAAGVFLYSWPIFELWVGSTLEDYQGVMLPAVYLSRILTIALAARAISDTWLLILYGAGYVRAYAPWILAGGLFAPIASVVLMFIVPKPMSLYVPAAVFAFVLLTVHQLGLPIIVGRCLRLSPIKLFAGVIRPLLATVVAAACAMLLLHLNNHLGDLGLTGEITKDRAAQMSAPIILASIGLFGIVYAVACFIFVLSKNDRERIGKLMKRKAEVQAER